MTKTHWKRCDSRIESLTLTINGLENATSELKKKLDIIEWYDGFWLLEEAEPIVGLAFIALQNYINSSIYDRFETLENKKYKLGNLIKKTGRTDIELIIAIANYFKHRDDHKELHTGTKKVLSDFDLHFNKNTSLTESTIIKGLELFSKDSKLTDLIPIVTKWREKLWEKSP